MEEAPSEVLRPSQGGSRGTLIPSGFESVAHPVFFRTIDVPPDSSTPSRRRRREASSTTSTTTIDPTATAARNLDALETESDLGLGTGAADRGAGSSKSKDERGLREVPSVCPICLEKFEQPVTLTSCLHTFCHTCILGWYEHTVAVALSRGDLSAFSPESGANLTDRGDGNRGGEIAGHTGRSRASKPYRCPLCQVPGPFFLAVERPSFKTKTSSGFEPTKLKFKLLGARTVFGGGGEKSGGVTVDEHSGAGAGGRHKRPVGDVGTLAGYPSPGMADLRAAARTQHALAAAAAREARAQAKPKPEESPLLASAGRGGEATAGGDKAGVGTKPSDVRAAQHVANGDQGVRARSIGRDESSSGGGGNGGGSSGRRASGADGDPARDTAAAERGGGMGGSTDRTRIATATRLEDGSQLLDRGEEPSHDGGNRESNQVTPHPGRGDDRERDRRKGRRRRRSEERSDSGLDFRDVFPVVGGSASEGSRGASLHALPERNRSKGSSSSSSSSTGSSGGSRIIGVRSDCSDGPRSSKRRKKRKRTARGEARKGETNSASCTSSTNVTSRETDSFESNGRYGRGRGVESGGASRSGRAAIGSGGLLWEPGSMPAEDGLQAIEALIAEEKESLRRETAGEGSLPL